MHMASSPRHPNSEWCEELGALAAIGELTASEFDELQRHLADCADCRQICADFRRMSVRDLGLVAVNKGFECESSDFQPPVDEEALFTRILERIPRERLVSHEPNRCNPGTRSRINYGKRILRIFDWMRAPAFSYTAVALALCAIVSVGTGRVKEAQFSPTLTELRSQVQDWKARTESSFAEKFAISAELNESQREREALAKSLRDAERNDAELRDRQKSLESKMAAANAQSERTGKDLVAARAVADEKNKEAADLLVRLQSVVQRAEEQQRYVDDLQKKLALAEQTARSEGSSASQGFSDEEARNLFGARDLHIVDVYDVDSNGTTKRTYGRVYYVEKKLLIFYAFDLQDKRHNRAAAGFQAWGYRQPNDSKPENLGLFAIDDASLNRWVLEYKNPRVLEHIDAVFVTLESPNGSTFPRGRRLLYANLASPPNHP